MLIWFWFLLDTFLSNTFAHDVFVVWLYCRSFILPFCCDNLSYELFTEVTMANLIFALIAISQKH